MLRPVRSEGQRGFVDNWAHTRGQVGGNSAGKILDFNLVRNFPLIFRGEVRNFPHAGLCL